VLAAGILFVLVPYLIFRKSPRWGFGDIFFAGLHKMVALTVLVVYLLLFVKLYEFFSLVGAFMLFAIINRKRRTREETGRPGARPVAAAVLDLLDRKRDAEPGVSATRAPRVRRVETPKSRDREGMNAYDWLTVVAAVAVLGMAGYLRFYDAIAHPAPALSDAYVTLAWMKYIDIGQLFHDGLYPQGFHIVLSMIGKVAQTNPLLVLKFAGPLANLVTVAGAYYFASRATRSPLGGLAAAFVLGVLPQWLPLEYARQASTNSQEFAMLFVLPSAWFILRYLVEGDGYDLVAGATGALAMGLVHPMVALFFGATVVACYISALLSMSTTFRRYVKMTLAGIGAAALAVAPIAVGLLMGVKPHESSEAFAFALGASGAPPMTPTLWAVVGLATLGLIHLLAEGRERRPGAWIVLLSVAAALALYHAPRFGLNNLALRARSGEFVALVAAAAAGAAVSTLTPSLRWSVAVRFLLYAVLISGLVGAAVLAQPTAASPYKMQSAAVVEQYLRISSTMRPSEWLIVGDNEMYALVLGGGWHIHTGDFLDQYDPAAAELVAGSGLSKGQTLSTSNILVFQEKSVYEPGVNMPEVRALVEKRKAQAGPLAAWIDAYRKTHDNMNLYYEDEDLAIWLIRQVMR